MMKKKLLAHLLIVIVSLVMTFGMILLVIHINIGISNLKTIIEEQSVVINEREFTIADLWEKNENCKGQLGIFYVKSE